MQKNIIKKGLVFAIIILFSVTVIIPNIGGEIKKDERNSRYILSNPPEEEWNKTYPIDVWGNSCVQETPDDCYIVIGSCGIGYWWDAYLLKVDKNGDQLWYQTFGDDGINIFTIDSGWWVENTNDGNYILVGGRDQPDDNPYSHDIWLIKTDSNGSMIWNKTYPGDWDDEGSCVKQTAEGGFIITGWYNDRSCLLKTDEYGNMLWIKTYGDHHSKGYSVVQTHDFGYIISGGIGSNDEYLWIIKTDTNGTFVWDKKIGGSYSCGMRIEQTFDNGFIIGGYTGSYGVGKADYWLIKINNTGDEEWNQTFGTTDWDWGYSGAIQTKDGGYIIGGEMSSSEKFWLVRTNGFGQQIWGDSDAFTEIKCYCIQQTKDHGYIASGIQNSKCILVKIGSDIQNNRPSKPTIDGRKNGRAGIKYEYTFNSTDYDGDNVTYYVDWGDGSPTEIVCPKFPIGNEAKASHQWIKNGTYNIVAQSRDTFGAYSEWSDQYPVKIPRNRVSCSFLFLRFLAHIPFLARLLQIPIHTSF